jgi:hypothetical protein
MSIAFNERAHRYRLDDRPAPSVSAVINAGLPKPALVRWSAQVVAEFVADNPLALDGLRATGRAPMVEALIALPDEARNVAAVRGTEVHALAERVAHGADVLVPGPLAARVEGYARWLDRFEPVVLLSECIVGNRTAWYAGRFDLIVVLDGVVWLLDIKTSKSVYGDTSLQCAAYARAEFYVHPGDGVTECEMPRVERIGVVHVTDDGTDLYDLGDIEVAYREFRAAQVIHAGNTRRRNLIERGAPVSVPTPDLDVWGAS